MAWLASRKLLPTPTARDHKDTGDLSVVPENSLLPRVIFNLASRRLLPTPTVGDSRNARNATAGRRSDPKPTTNAGWTLSDIAHASRWGMYRVAIGLHARLVGRAAPPATDDTGRLSPAFVEWMMGWPDGWVSSLPLARTHQLRICGNGVVPQQAAFALALLDPDGTLDP